MAKVFADRVRESTTTTGLGSYTLGGAVTGFRTFLDGVANTNTCYYCVTNGVDWEVTYGTLSGGTTLSRDSVQSSSNAGAAVNWGAGTKDVFVTIPAAAVGASARTVSVKTGAYTVVAGDLGAVINCTSGTFTVSLTAAATLGAGFWVEVWNSGSGSIIVDPAGAELIGVADTTYTLNQGMSITLTCTGTGWLLSSLASNGAAAGSVVLGSGASATAAGVAVGRLASATGTDAISIGTGNTAASSYAVTIGRFCSVASGASGSTALGYDCAVTGSPIGAVVIGHTATSSADRAIAIGGNVTAGSTRSTAIGSNSGIQGSVTATGSGAMALGGSYASGTDSFAAAIANNTSSYGATGPNSVALGRQSKASGTYGNALGGYANVASGNWSSVLNGRNAVASGAQSTVLNGQYAVADINGLCVLGVANAAIVARAQSGKLILYAQTTTATPDTAVSDGAAAGTTNQVILPNDSTYAFTILVVARRTDADNESAGYKFEGVVDRNGSAATTALVGSVTKTVLAEDTVAWDCNVTADTTNGGLKVEVTGEAAKTIRWVATCWTSEVTG